MYRSDKNTGLSSAFQLKGGRFVLEGGVVKCQDNMNMLLAFANGYRYFYQDFCVNLYWMLQRQTSFIQTFKTLFLGQFVFAGQRYAPFVTIQKANVFYNAVDRKDLILAIEYTYVLEPDTKAQFVQIIN